MSQTVTFVTPSLDPLGNAGQLPLWAATLQVQGWAVSIISLRDAVAGDQALRYPGMPVTCLGLGPREWNRWRDYFQILAAQRPTVLHLWDCPRSLIGSSRKYASHLVETNFFTSVNRWAGWPWNQGAQADLQLVFQESPLMTGGADNFGRPAGENEALSLEAGQATLGTRVQRVHKAPQRLLESRALTRARLSEQLGLEPDAKWIVGAARLSPETNCKGLIWGIDQLKIIRDDCHLLLLGAGPQQRRLERFLSLTEAESRTHFLGVRADGPEIVAAADIFWQADLTCFQPEGLLQALSSGIPAVSAYGPATEDLVLPQQTAWCARPEARYEYARWSKFFLEERERTAQLSEQARRYVQEHFPQQRVESEIENLYRQF